MMLISEQDRHYIENKYHFADREFDAFKRWNYHGEEFDPSTGLDDDAMREMLAAKAAELAGQPHPVIKAELFALVLDNTRIEVNEHDAFVGIWSWNRPLRRFTADPWQEEILPCFPEERKRLKESSEAGGSFGWLDFDHTVPDWDSLMELGFPGILARARACYSALAERGALTEKKEAFFRGLETEYLAVLRLLDRFARYARTKGSPRAEKIASCMQRLHDGAPQCMYDAMQLIYLYFMISESIDNYQVRSLGYGLDGTLYPFYEKDRREGVPEEELRSLMAHFLLQWSSIGNYWGQPFYLGGTNMDGSTKVNSLSRMILDVYDTLNIYNPKIQIKIGKSTPKDFVLQALEMIRGGNSSIVFCSEDHITKALMTGGATYEEALDSVISGCYEYKVKRKGIGMSCQYPNPVKPVSLVFDNGFDRVTGRQFGLKTGDVTGFGSFGEFYEAYRKQLVYMLEEDWRALDRIATKINDVNPSLLFSATIPECVETMTDALDCGIENLSGFTFGGVGTAADALMAVYELVYEKKETTLAELKKALEANWEGYEGLRAKALKCRHKYGNGDVMADSYAREILRLVREEVLGGKVNSHGGRLQLEAHSARAFIINGEKTAATPDGRKAGEEISKNASPTPGADRSGITALIESAVALSPDLCNNGFCLDAMLHPSAVAGEEGLEAFYGVLMSYMRRGGASIHFNIFNTETLRDAQRHPEKYKNLQVRVCGWNVLWNNLPKSEQDAYILRAENAAG